MEYSGNSKKRQIVAALAVLIVVVVIVGAATAANKKKAVTTSVATTPKTTTTQTTTSSAATPTAPVTDTSAAVATNTSGYADGSYTATGTYESPGGQEKITITVALKDGIVTSTSAKSGAGDPTAEEYQNDFISGYKSKVVGKSIASLSLSRVSGSSLTSQGFNDAIQNIKNQAKA